MAKKHKRHAEAYKLIADRITLETVLASKILPSTDLAPAEAVYERVGSNADGTVWFKDKYTLVCYKVGEDSDDKLVVLETRSLKKAPKEHKTKTAFIKCIDCGNEREVATQDAFQVKRCKECQRKHRNRKRADRAKAKRKERSDGKLIEKLNTDQ